MLKSSEENGRSCSFGLLGADSTETGGSYSAFFTKINFVVCGCFLQPHLCFTEPR